MKVLITESRLYTAFKGWMDSEISSGLYEWAKDMNGDILLVDTSGYGHLGLDRRLRNLYVFKQLFTEINNYFPLERTDLLKLIERYVCETFQIKRINTQVARFEKTTPNGITIPIELKK
jgi:hypothetical protein